MKKTQRGYYKRGYLRVTDGHRLYYECYGNPKGKPVLFIHGGPGSGFSDRHKKLFHPRMFNVILFDQRGAKRSKPFASLTANTTPKLVADCRRVLDFFKIDKAFVVGGSWGSTLSLAFALRYPERVSALLVSAIFLGSKKSIHHYISGGVKASFPEAWGRFISHVPPRHRRHAAAYYFRQMFSKDHKTRQCFIYEWAFYESSIAKLVPSPREIKRRLEDWSFESLSRIEAHYMVHQCFLPDNYILRHAHRLAHLPVSIVHGRYDAICTYGDAYALHQRIKGSRLFVVPTGHVSSEPPFKRRLKKEIKFLTKRI